jgi:type IV pilus assembly protein PilN
MIRINLYPGGQRQKRGKRAAAPEVSQGGSLAGLLLVLVVVAAVAAAGNLWYYRQLMAETARLEIEKQKMDMDYVRLSQVKARYLEREKQKELYKRRVDVIDQLRSNQAGPVKLLSMLSGTVNHTDEVWLTTMTDDGANIHLNGVALSVHGVANLMRNLQDSGFFKSVDIRTSYQDEGVQDMQAFNFELICQKQPPAGPPAQAGSAPKKS